MIAVVVLGSCALGDCRNVVHVFEAVAVLVVVVEGGANAPVQGARDARQRETNNNCSEILMMREGKRQSTTLLPYIAMSGAKQDEVGLLLLMAICQDFQNGKNRPPVFEMRFEFDAPDAFHVELTGLQNCENHMIHFFIFGNQGNQPLPPS